MYTVKKPKYLLFDKHFLVITLLALGAVASVTAVTQRTGTQQQASQSSNLNTASQIESSLNPDGTMGPPTSQNNFATSLPNAYLGNLSLNVIDSSNSPRLSSLTLTITKAETHLIYLFLPGASNTSTSENLSSQKTNQNVNKWETIQLGNPAQFDLLLTGGESASLGLSQLAGGKYSEIRLYVSKAKAKLTNGEEVTITIPGNANIIRIVKPFNIFSNQTTYLTLDFNSKNSVIQTGDTYFLQPFISGLSISN